MRVTLTQSRGQKILRGWILIRIESNDVCTQISTSATFDPYKEIYIWLGQIQDSQLPARMIIDEEGRGVELLAERINNEVLYFHIEPWFCGEDNLTRLGVSIKSNELIKAFCEGILEFIKNRYYPTEWSYINSLSNLNWNSLLQPVNLPDRKWKTRLAIYGGGHGRVPETGRKCLEQSLTTEQQWLVVLYDALSKIALFAHRGQIYESCAFVSLYQNLLADLILNELDSDWYKKRISEIEPGFENIRISSRERDPKRVRLETQARFSTLKLGQLVDGKAHRVKSYGVFVDIVGCCALLSISTISQASLTHLYEKAEEMADRYRQNVLSKLQDE